MQLFTRRVLMAGPPDAITEYAINIRAYVADRIGREVGLWAGLFGGPLGSMFFTMHVEGLADLRAATEPLMTDAEYHRMLAQGREYMAAPSEDSLGTPLLGELDEMPPVGSYAQVVQAVVAPGMYEQAIGWGVEVAQYVSGVTGVPEMVLMGQFGEFGNMTWLGISPDAATVDRANAAMNADAGYMKRLGETKDMFVPGSGMQGLVTRVA